MVGVSKGFAGNGPRIVPAHLVLINQHAQQLRNGNGRVSIVELNNFKIRQLMKFTPCQMMAAQNVSYRTGTLEVLLHQAQLFTRGVVIVRVQHFRQFFGVDALLLCAQEITVVKFGQVKRMRVAGLPQTQRLRYAVTVAENWQIPGLTGDGKTWLPVAVFADLAANPNLHIQRLIVTEPRVAATMPVIRGFHLLPIGKRLTEQAVLVVEAIPCRRLADSRHRIEEAGCQAPQSTVTQRRIGLFFQQVGQVDIMCFQLIAHLLIPAEVE